MSSCQVRRQRAVGGIGNTEGWRGGGDQRPGGFGEMAGGEVTDEGGEDADEGGELHGCDDIREASKDGG